MVGSVSSGWRAFWARGRWWTAVLIVVVYLGLYLLAGLGLGRIFGHLVDNQNIFATPASVFFGIGAPLVVGAILLSAFVASLGWWRPIFARQPLRGRWWMWIFVVFAVAPVVLRLFGIDYGSYGAGVVPMAFFVGLLIGFTEELLYRGIVVKILRDGGHREWMVAVVSSLLFALSHTVNLISGQPLVTVAVTVVFTFGFGMMMYLVMRATGNIIWAMLLHALPTRRHSWPAVALTPATVQRTTLFSILRHHSTCCLWRRRSSPWSSFAARLRASRSSSSRPDHLVT